jgi:hypothetical protein
MQVDTSNGIDTMQTVWIHSVITVIIGYLTLALREALWWWM